MLLRRRIINFAFGERVEALLIVQSDLNVTWRDLYFVSGIQAQDIANKSSHDNISTLRFASLLNCSRMKMNRNEINLTWLTERRP